MDNQQASSDIVNQESIIEVTSVEVEIAPLDAGQPPTESDVGSHLKNMSWRDGAEVLADAADFIPGLGSLIKATVGLGDYSPEARLKEKQFKWVIQKVGEISHKIDILLKRLSPDEQIEAADVAAIINAAMKASEKTADAKKRKLLKNAVVNAFDVEQYQAGLTLRLFKILENVEYGDVEILRKIYQKNIQENNGAQIGILKSNNSYGIGDMLFHHLKILEEQDLIVMWNTSTPLGSGNQGVTKISDLEKQFLEFIKDTQ